MIRPRTGSFTYTNEEVETMLADIAVFEQEGVGGFVFGCLGEDGDIDVKSTRRLVDAARPLEVTFHRAFDVTPDWRRAFEDILSIDGITRVLTSGHAKNALLGSSELSSQIAEANDPRHPRKVIICPASGINATNVGRLRELVPQMEEVHLSSSSAVRGGGREAVLKGVEMGFGADEVWRMDVGRFEDFWRVVKRWNQKG